MNGTTPGRLLLAVLAITAGLLAAGCSGSSHSGSAGAAASSAKAGVHSAAGAITSSPCYQADKAQLKAELLANFQKNFTAKHPVTSAKAAIRATFPQGDVTAIINHGVATLTPALSTSHAARVQWADDLAGFALTQGGVPVASPSPGSAVVPGYPAACGTVTPSPSTTGASA
jgi:hypothetical protein